jgi:toxin-antitoxin system PIN domain toxin
VTLAVDTNVLVYAHRPELPAHGSARTRLRALAEGLQPVVFPWPCLYEFLRVVTHRNLFRVPSKPEVAVAAVADLLAFPTVRTISETDRHFAVLASLIDPAAPSGNLMHDAHIAALLLEHGVTDLLTEDKDFHRFPGVRVVRLRDL